MSAVIGILNKHAIALAADSAVTISGGGNRKILNTANKIFTLSKYHPVGVMIYNSAEFMGTPWEIIIKMYREQLGEKSFKKVDDYRKDFVKYLKDQNFFSDHKDQKKALYDYCFLSLNILNREATQGHEDLLKKLDKSNREKVLALIGSKTDEYIKIIEKEKPFDDFKEFKISSFSSIVEEPFEYAIKIIFKDLGFDPSDKLQKMLLKFLFMHLKAKSLIELQPFSGLVFVGYGDKQIYPHLVPMNISFAIEDKLRACIDTNRSAHISNEMHSVISPFAQTDVIDTILSGIDPVLKNVYHQNFSIFLAKYNELIANLAEEESGELAGNIRSLDIEKLTQNYVEEVNEIQRSTYINKMLQSVSSLPKEDLAEMAESLIYLTYLKRRITFAEESVGGPVDVALITKGDGFIWMKRKHYFKPDLNHQFFETYLK